MQPDDHRQRNRSIRWDDRHCAGGNPGESLGRILGTMRSIRDWYLLSRKRRGQFFAEIDGLTSDGLVSLVRHELKQAAVNSLRTLEDIANYERAALPSLAELKRKKPNEQTLQYFFMHRRYF